MDVTLTVNGERHLLTLDDPRVSLLDALRQRLDLTGTKKGCDHGQCGACTVILNGRRINSCLTLAVMHDGAAITTIEGIGAPGDLSPLQQAFIRHDVELAPGSTLARRLGVTTIAVESAHHQAVDVVGAGLVVTASAEDGTIEALEHERAPIVCVQWHPEDTGAIADQLPALLDELRDRLPGAAAGSASATSDQPGEVVGS